MVSSLAVKCCSSCRYGLKRHKSCYPKSALGPTPQDRHWKSGGSAADPVNDLADGRCAVAISDDDLDCGLGIGEETMQSDVHDKVESVDRARIRQLRKLHHFIDRTVQCR